MELIRENNEVNYRKLPRTSHFIFESIIYIKINDQEAVDINTGMTAFLEDVKVIPVRITKLCYQVIAKEESE